MGLNQLAQLLVDLSDSPGGGWRAEHIDLLHKREDNAAGGGCQQGDEGKRLQWVGADATPLVPLANALYQAHHAMKQNKNGCVFCRALALEDSWARIRGACK